MTSWCARHHGFLGAPFLSQPRVPVPSLGPALMAIRKERILRPPVRAAGRAAFPLRHLPSEFQHPDVRIDLLAQAWRPASTRLSSPGRLRRISPDRTTLPGLAPDHPAIGGAARSSLHAPPRGAEAARPGTGTACSR